MFFVLLANLIIACKMETSHHYKNGAYPKSQTSRNLKQNMKLPNASKIILLAFIIPMLWGCSSDKLSRGKAGEIIKNSVQFPFESTFLDNSPIVGTNGELPDGASPIIYKMTIFFTEKKLLKVINQRYDGNWYYWRLDFTEDGLKYAAPDRNSNTIAKLCEYTFNEVTGVQINDQTKVATVEYSVKRTGWTPFGLEYKKEYPARFPDILSGLRATFQKYDDGWRLVSSGADVLKQLDEFR
jgi:hypothetical protein